jgi:hypothetical protein
MYSWGDLLTPFCPFPESKGCQTNAGPGFWLRARALHTLARNKEGPQWLPDNMRLVRMPCSVLIFLSLVPYNFSKIMLMFDIATGLMVDGVIAHRVGLHM